MLVMLRSLAMLLRQGCEKSFFDAFPAKVFEYTGGLPRLVVATYTAVFAWICIRRSRGGVAVQLTVADIPRCLNYVFDFLYERYKVRAAAVVW